MKKIKLLLGVLLLLILAVSCGNKTNAGKKRVIKVGTDGVYAPFSFKDKVQLVGEPLSTTPTFFLFRKDSEELRNEVNKALAEMRADGTLAKISEKWFGGDYTK